MNSPADNISPPGNAGGQGGEHQYWILAALGVPVEWMRFCTTCDSEQRFVADRECSYGLVGSCANCGEERVVPFSRTTWWPA